MELQVLSQSGLWYIRLVDGDGKSLMHSQTYHSGDEAEQAAYNIQNNWPPLIVVRTINAETIQ
jgi:hypothetical protein